MDSIFNSIFFTNINWIDKHQRCKARVYRSTKPKRDKEKEKKLKKISYESKRKNRGVK